MEELTLENVLRRCGDFGRYQWIHFFFLCIINFSSGITGFYYVFGLAEPAFRCRLPSNIWSDDDQYKSINATHQALLNAYLLSSSKCENINRTSCHDFVYDRSVYGRTFTEEGNFICSNAMKKTWLSTVYQIGTFTVLVTGPISDRIGRRKILQVLSFGLYLITGITQVLLQFVKMDVSTKFILLNINQLVSGIDGYGIAFLLIMELTSSSHTSFAAGLSLVAYPIGECLFTAFAFASRDWLNLKWLTSAYFLLTVPYLYFIPESPYWLLSRKKYDQLESALRKIARTNRREEIQWHPYYTKLIEETIVSKKVTDAIIRRKREKMLQYLPKLVISGFIEFVTMLLYTQISYGLGAMNEAVNPYTNFLIGAAVESLGYLIAGLLVITMLGRKYSLITFSLLTSTCVLMIPFTMHSYPVIGTVISQIGKMAISGAVAVSWLYVPELFPTSMRGLANAIFVFIGSFGSILAPIIDTAVGDKHKHIAFYFYAGLTLFLAGLITSLPETRNRSFDDGEEHDDITLIDDNTELNN
ncbi:unnamed protein product [Rotaria sp. Silwood2]|nr:unnamed protein product [Rotaria sp. Silwood2]CAF2520435.1 unnamed protein product [Rotaria sp. Silwood2]CAF2920505.1 unnamed protein product [Rotaria sp. Silwood2]CAF3937755.1 unnamed protein product [Rotaria sp. Silwood2]CAF4046394.1 unnamed protein product [Rotaria sp. Silwood2]